MKRWWLLLTQHWYWRRAHELFKRWTCDTCPRGFDLATWQREHRRTWLSVHIMSEGIEGCRRRYRRRRSFGRYQGKS